MSINSEKWKKAVEILKLQEKTKDEIIEKAAEEFKNFLESEDGVIVLNMLRLSGKSVPLTEGLNFYTITGRGLMKSRENTLESVGLEEAVKEFVENGVDPDIKRNPGMIISWLQIQFDRIAESIKTN